MEIRRAGMGDAAALAALLREYLRERHPDHPGATAAELSRDVLAGRGSHRVLLAELRGEAIGFVAWDPVYDMHWAARGAQVADLYVAPGSRGHGVALALVCGLCAEARADGAVFLRGSAFDRARPRAASTSASPSPSTRGSVTAGEGRSGTWPSCTAAPCGCWLARFRRGSGTSRPEHRAERTVQCDGRRRRARA